MWYCQQQGIAITGFSPLGASSYIQLGMDKGEGVGVLGYVRWLMIHEVDKNRTTFCMYSERLSSLTTHNTSQTYNYMAQQPRDSGPRRQAPAQPRPNLPSVRFLTLVHGPIE